MKFWEAFRVVEDSSVPPNTVHVVPHDDITAHTMTDDCVCGPTVERVDSADGGDGWLHIHHSLDGRELTEMKYRKKPVIIDAYRITEENVHDLATKCGGKVSVTTKPSDNTDTRTELLIPTLEGTKTGLVGEWLIRGVKGEWYPCKHGYFRATYEPASDSTPDIPEA